MQKYHTPEILRLPLQELCLHTKLLAPANTPIADFLAKAIEPPSFVITRNAVQLLKTMDALDAWERPHRARTSLGGPPRRTSSGKDGSIFCGVEVFGSSPHNRLLLVLQ
ncbi:unnamed protein product, partial [Timema podura]|nr:unnamed protein product [Timema podura]